ncbi:hypothetical protein [Aestuariimicrobium ganziense]|uniref:hypothetical protein n=1 Tax=Aestuariimicrobium ganziense TaxID=2773677 RepID=UPI0019413E1A|nr:hypothetical protein [Aestuariimicrobium ganziense]
MEERVTQWSELEDLGLTEESDEFDPLAPMQTHAGGAVGEQEDDEYGTPLVRVDPHNGEVNYEVPFGDPLGVVRVWINDSKVITKVRVSPNWREKLSRVNGGKAGAVQLGHAFGVAFAGINNYDRIHQENTTVDLDGSDDLPEAREPLSWAAMARLNERSMQVHERFEALRDDEGHGHWEGEAGVGRAAGGKVSVTVAHTGKYDNVTFDETWLQGSRAREVCDAVVAAAGAAMASKGESTYVPGERDELRQERSAIRDELRALMRRGFY